MVEEAEKFKQQDTEERERIEAKNTLENAIYSFKDSVEKLQNDVDRDAAKDIINNVQIWFDNNPNASKDEYNNEFKILQEKMMEYISKANQEQQTNNNETQDNEEDNDGPRIDEVD